MESNNAEKITVETIVNEPIAKVWTYWTAPEHITQWYNASADWHAPYAENNIWKGGTFKITMAAKDGSFSFDLTGIYTFVKEHHMIDFTLTDGRKVEVRFISDGMTTKIIETFDAENTNPVAFQKAGWQAILDNFKRYTENK